MLAWPNYPIGYASRTKITALLDSGQLTPSQTDAFEALLARRQALRIRGLETRYLVGKTATSEGEDSNKLVEIRHQVAAIEEEIEFVELTLSELLDAYSRRSGPWLVVFDEGDCSIYWLVPADPCNEPRDIVLESHLPSIWMEATVVAEAIPGFVPPGTCAPLRVDVGCPQLENALVLNLSLDGEVLRFAVTE